jgi:hypothetical protein
MKSGLKAKLWRLVTTTIMEQNFILAMFCSSRRELSFPECGGSKLLRNAPMPDYTNTQHRTPDAVTLIFTTAFQYLPVFLTVSLYRIFLAVSFVTRITLSLNTTSQNRNIMTDHWMRWHFIQGSAVLTGWVCEPVTYPQNITALHLSNGPG